MDISKAREWTSWGNLMSRKGTHPVRADLIEQLRQSQGLSLNALALKADLSLRQMKRILNGGMAYIATINRLAKTLNVETDALRADIDLKPMESRTEYRLDLSIAGMIDDAAKSAVLIQITPKIIALLKEHGVDVRKFNTALALNEYADQDLRRTIALIYGLLDTGDPFWAFVAVRSSLYRQFVSDQRSGKMDLTKFDQYGEIIICGEGYAPAEDIISTVANMYQTDLESFKKSVAFDIEKAKPVLDAWVTKRYG